MQVIHQQQDLLPASNGWMLYKDHHFPPEHTQGKNEIRVVAIKTTSTSKDQHTYFALVNEQTQCASLLSMSLN
jgi:hypothetical protein